MTDYHASVMGREAVEYLGCRGKKGIWVDATLGHGGHSLLMLEAADEGAKLIGVETDKSNLKIAEERIGAGGNFTGLHGNFRHIDSILKEAGAGMINGILYDLGVSGAHFDNAERGFSFAREAVLDMRLDTGKSFSAGDVINGYREDELGRVIREYGEEPHWRRITAAIIAARPVKTTLELAAVISRVKGGYHKINPATKVFQAVRIEVNDELNALKESIEKLPSILAPGGRVVIISFHSLEDR
ncbi:MAG TPA: 16S rRNA (cytosine(1402)-N(4))-methyltransferase RsmH, partial [bacterium]|nr:16S rRNA (cytosine(1402)-N(4))-methyltransferase RsmH [bacterium]